MRGKVLHTVPYAKMADRGMALLHESEARAQSRTLPSDGEKLAGGGPGER